MSERKSDSGMETLDIEIQCPVQTRTLAVLRAFAAAVATQMGFDDEEADKIEMAVDEACANVVRHAYKHLGVSPDLPAERQTPDPETHRSCVLKVRIAFTEDCLEIAIIDHGIGQNNTPPGVSSVEEFTARGGGGGLGVYIIRNFMDEVAYEYPPECGTRLTMKKYLRPAEQSPG